MRHRKTRHRTANPSNQLATILLCLLVATLVAACGGSSGGGGGDDDENENGDENGDDTGDEDNTDNGDDNGTTSACDGELTPADNGSGLTAGANAGHLQFFAHEDRLCAFDPDSGVAFEVDQGLNPISDIGAFDQDDGTRWPVLAEDEDGLYVNRVVYVADNEIRQYHADQTSDARGSPERISSESAADEIDRMMVSPDYNDPGRGGIAYEKDDGWYAARLSDDGTGDPEAFGEGREPLGPITDFTTGNAVGWLVRDETPGGTAEGTVISVDLDLADESDHLISPTRDLASLGDGSNFAMDAQMDDAGTIVFSADVDGDRKFFVYEPGGDESVEEIGTLPNVRTPVRATDGSAVYVAAIDGGPDQDDTAYLGEVDPQSKTVEIVDTEDEADVDNSGPIFVTTTGDHVVWGWNPLSSGFPNGDGPNAVQAWDKADDTSEEIVEFGSDRRLSVDEVAVSGAGHVFFNSTDGSEQWAHAVDVDGSGDEEVHDSDEWWIGASSPGDAFVPYGAAPHNSISLDREEKLSQYSAASEVFLSGEGGLQAVSADAPADPVDLGSVAEDPPSTTSRLGFGPHRLLRNGGSGNAMYYVDVEDTDSLRELADDTDSDEQRLRVIPGS